MSCSSHPPSFYASLDASPLKFSTLIIALSFGAVFGCANTEVTSQEERDTEGLELGKADITVGPIERLSCAAEHSFVRRGGFARFEVEALDSTGVKSRNYSLQVTPEVGARVVQRDQVIFDLDGLYTVRCCAHDTPLCDQVAVRVGEYDPALALSVHPFSVGEVSLSGHALDQAGKPARVSVDGRRVESDERGHFEVRLPTTQGLNRFEVLAEGSAGGWAVRHAWSVGGPFADINSINPAAARLRLGPAAYPQLSALLTELLVREVSRYSESAELKQTQSGRSLGYEWEVTPTGVEVAQPSLVIREGGREGELIVSVELMGFTVFADGQTRFSGEWKQRDVELSADLAVELVLSPHERGLEVVSSRTSVDQLNIEISDMPGFFEGVLEWVFEGRLEDELVRVVEGVGDRGLSEVLMGFEVNERLSLPAQLSAELEVSGRVVELSAGARGLTLGLGLSIDGETDPARVEAPGPVMMSAEPPELGMHTPYELSLHLDVINRLMFAAWQTGGLDFIHDKSAPFGDDEGDFWQTERLTVFVTPELPPVVRPGEREGELVIEVGALRLDGVLEGELAVLNFALEAGARLRAQLTGGPDQLSVSAAVEGVEADVLIAPAGWEREPTRRALEALISEDVAPKYAELLSQLPLPTADLSALELEGVQSLSIRDLSVKTPSHSLSVGAQLELK